MIVNRLKLAAKSPLVFPAATKVQSDERPRKRRRTAIQSNKVAPTVVVPALVSHRDLQTVSTQGTVAESYSGCAYPVRGTLLVGDGPGKGCFPFSLSCSPFSSSALASSVWCSARSQALTTSSNMRVTLDRELHFSAASLESSPPLWLSRDNDCASQRSRTSGETSTASAAATRLVDKLATMGIAALVQREKKKRADEERDMVKVSVPSLLSTLSFSNWSGDDCDGRGVAGAVGTDRGEKTRCGGGGGSVRIHVVARAQASRDLLRRVLETCL